MRMDDHIYSSQPITAAEAAAYLQEITTLKLRCLPTNVRALQVIEKLTRLMSNILTEENINGASSSHNQSFQMPTQFVGSASPVYSLPDEDRNIHVPGRDDVEDLNQTYITDESNDEEVEISNKVIAINTTQEKNDSTYAEKAKELIEIIDITNDSDIEDIQTAKEKNTSIEHVNNGIKNMTLQDELGSRTQADNYTWSQSILDNFDNNLNNEAAKGKDRIEAVQTISHHKVNTKTHDIDNVNDNCEIRTPLSVMPSQATIAPQVMVVKTTMCFNNQPVNQRSDFQENTNKKARKVTKKKVIRRTKKNKEPNEDNAAQVCLQRPYTTVKSIKFSQNNNDKENQPKTVKKSKNNKKANDIYNENVENDLSWVENLRFVREISPSEYDPVLTTLQDNFWDNFQLPGTWDDLDFNV